MPPPTVSPAPLDASLLIQVLQAAIDTYGPGVQVYVDQYEQGRLPVQGVRISGGQVVLHGDGI